MIADILDVFSAQMAVLGRNGRVVECNSAFAEALARGTPVMLDAEGGVAFSGLLDHRAFQAALPQREATSFCTTETGPDPMVVTVRPLEGRGFDLVLMSIVLLRPERVSLGFLRPRYGLTFAETRVTELVVRGLPLQDVAASIGVSKTTARNQLTSAMSKLGVRRQAQLVAMVMTMFPKFSMPAPGE